MINGLHGLPILMPLRVKIMQIRWERRKIVERVANTAFDGQPLIGGGSCEVARTIKVLQYFDKECNCWMDVPTEDENVWMEKK
jgi:hypothetical protein